MAKLSAKKLQQIIEQADPGSRVVDTGAGGARGAAAAADFDTPDLDALRQKYLGAAGDAKKTGKAAKAKAPAPADEVSIVSVEKKQKRDPWDRSSRPKAVVVSDNEERIIGRQG